MKKSFKRLSLQKETLVNLNETGLKNALGGAETESVCLGPCCPESEACLLTR